jgi:hypothetical protein
MKKTKNIKTAGWLVAVLLLMAQTAFAGVGGKINKYVSSEFNNLSGLYIILGVLAFGIIGKIVHHFFMREESSPVVKSGNSSMRHHRHRHGVKKTS